MEISIINSYPTNSGDLALLEATLYGLKTFAQVKKINVFCHPSGKSFVPNELDAQVDLEYILFDFERGAMTGIKKFLKKVVWKLKGGSFVISKELFPTSAQKDYIQTLNQSDYIISSAGSYLTDVYHIQDRLWVLDYLVKKYPKKVLLLSQSIGPITKPMTSKFMESIYKHSKEVVLREAESLKYVSSEKAVVKKDVCFLLAEKYKQVQKPVGTIKKIAVSFRAWDGLDESKIVSLLSFLLNEKNFEVTSLSTCQGITDYKDDSIFIKGIKDKYPELKKLKINSDYHTPESLIKQYHEFDVYIGMRLHGAILSLIAQTPAFIIGYEHKSKGVFETIGLGSREIFHDRPSEEWLAGVQTFLNSYKQYQQNLASIISTASQEAKENFSAIV